MSLNLPGRHNVQNALAAVAVASEFGIDDDAIRRGLGEFQGIARRLQVHGDFLAPNGRVTLVDDYAHHPRELDATLDAVRGALWEDGCSGSSNPIATPALERFSRTSSKCSPLWTF